MIRTFSKIIVIVIFCFLDLQLANNIFTFAQNKSASLFLSPSSGSYEQGSTFSVTVAVNSAQEAINAAEANLKFNPSLIRVRSISKANSIFAFWPEEPNFSNQDGIIKFVGGSPTSYKGNFGRIITITFEAVQEGTAQISFTSGKILAADGLGTDITGSLLSASYTITKASITKPTKPISQILPPAPKITSPSHPDQNKWYQNNSPLFSWDLPEGVNAIRLGINTNPNASPANIYQPPIAERKVENLEDGIWYFSAQFRNEAGWGPIARFKVQIDSTPPDPFDARIDNGGDPTNSNPTLYFEANDKTSGIDRYEIISDEKVIANLKPEEIKEGWKTFTLSPGEYNWKIKAYDKAGNSSFSISELKFSVKATQESRAELSWNRIILYLIILLIILIILGIIAIIKLWQKVNKVEKDREKDLPEESISIQQKQSEALKVLKEKVKEQVEYLQEKQDLSRSEIKILNALKEALSEAETKESQSEK